MGKKVCLGKTIITLNNDKHSVTLQVSIQSIIIAVLLEIYKLSFMQEIHF